jgi:hypothetical protein
MGSTIEAPPARNYGQETRDTLRAQLDLAPEVYQAEAQYRPKYAALNIDTMRTALLGADGKGGGLLDTYEKDIATALSRVQSADRDARITGEMSAIETYAPRITRSLREASGNAPLLDEMQAQAMEGLKAGAGLDASLAGEVEQGVRSAQSARGFGFGAPDAVAEAFARGSRGLQLRQQRRADAAGVVALNQATAADPFMAILGRPSQTLGMIPGVAGQAAGANQGALFNPESGYASDVFNSNFNAAQARAIGNANNEAAITGAAIGAAGSAMGSM